MSESTTVSASTVWIVVSHYSTGSSTWVRSTKEKALELQNKLLSDEAYYIEDDETRNEFIDLLKEGKNEEAHELWQEDQMHRGVYYLEAILIAEGEVDGDNEVEF